MRRSLVSSRRSVKLATFRRGCAYALLVRLVARINLTRSALIVRSEDVPKICGSASREGTNAGVYVLGRLVFQLKSSTGTCECLHELEAGYQDLW